MTGSETQNADAANCPVCDKGYALLDKSLYGTRVWQDPEAFRLYTYLLLNAAPTDTFTVDKRTGEKIAVLKNQVAVTRNLLAKEVLGSERNKDSAMIYRRLDMLKREGLIDLKASKKMTIVTILNQVDE